MARILRGYTVNAARLQADRVSERYQYPVQRAALVSALVEFQRTQVFFMLSLQTAALVALYDRKILGVQDWEGLIRMLSFFNDLATSGGCTVVANLLVLRKDGPLEWLTLGWSGVCVVVSATTWIATHFKPVGINDFTPMSQEIWECAGFLDQRKYCQSAYNYAKASLPVSSLMWATFVLPILVMFCLLVDRANVFGTVHPVSQVAERVNIFVMIDHWLSRKGHQPLRSRMFRLTRIIFAYFAEAWLVYANVFLLVKFFGWLNISQSQWTLGQIIAVAVWAPVFAEYIHLMIRGIEKAFRARLARGYKVVAVTPASATQASHPPHTNVGSASSNSLALAPSRLQTSSISYPSLPISP
ncbi:hypothetical protein LTS14_004993 [Recurvomyces mirabilis]|nr:hypothetical protein LTS14_004993 [Recurvomyces mirabilis]